MAYMKKVGDATTDVGYGPGWFKISQAGLNVASKFCAMQDSYLVLIIGYSWKVGC